MVCTQNKIDSNVTGLSFAEELCLGQLPYSVTPGDDLLSVWIPLDPNSYSNFGADVKTVARNPINASRQNKKGVVTDLDVSGEFEQDLTKTNLTQLLQGFFFADAHEKPTNQPISGAASAKVTLANYTSANQVNIASGDEVKFQVGHILKTSNNVVVANNQNDVVVTATAAGVLTTAANTFAAESIVQNVNKLETVGYQFAAGIATLSVSGAMVKLVRSSGSFTTLGLNVGEWIFIGGDSAVFNFVTGSNKPGYARIKSISATELSLDQCTWVPVTDAGAAKTIRIYFGAFLRNEKNPSLIKRRTYTLERTLGSDADGEQSEYLIGSVPNDFKLDVKAADKLMCNLSFVGQNNDLRTGLEGKRPGNRTATIAQEDAFNTSSDIVQCRLFIVNSSVITPTSLFGFISEGTIEIKNGIKGNKAIGKLGSFEMSTGNFEVSGSLKLYFSTVLAVEAIKANADVSFNFISARQNYGFIYDIPLLGLGGGRIDVKKDDPIMLPVTNAAAENSWGYTIASVHFGYLPNIAMPV